MKVLDNSFIIIPQSENNNKNKHYTKATFVDIDKDKLEEIMNLELLYGDQDYY
jgi:hypothetical protein